MRETIDASDAMASGAATRERNEVVGPFLAIFEAGGPGIEIEDESTRINVRDRTIELDSWESSVLSRGLETDRGDGEWQRRLAEGVAFQASYITHLQTLQGAPPPAANELKALRRELITDAAVGLALQEELQRDINNLVATGALDEAKKLSAFRHKIGQGVGRLKECIGDEGFVRAEARADEMAAPAPKQEKIRAAVAPSPLEQLPMPPKPVVSRAPVRHVHAEKSGHVRPLLLTLVFCLLAWGIFFVTTQEISGPPPLPEELFLRFAGVQGVDVRPPSLFVTVHAGAWSNMTDEERYDLIGDVGAIASKNGYRGAHFRTTAGASVAEWLDKSGARLIINRKTKPGDRT